MINGTSLKQLKTTIFLLGLSPFLFLDLAFGYPQNGYEVGFDYSLNDTLLQKVLVLQDSSVVMCYVASFQIYIEVLDQDLQIRKNRFEIQTQNSNKESFADAATFKNGNFIILWKNAQIFSKDGEQLFDEIHLDNDPSISIKKIKVFVLSNDNFVIIWQKDVRGPPRTKYISSQLFSPSGDKIGSESQVLVKIEQNTTTTDFKLLELEDDSYVIAWLNYEWPDNSGYYCNYQFFSNDGNSRGQIDRLDTGPCKYFELTKTQSSYFRIWWLEKDGLHYQNLDNNGYVSSPIKLLLSNNNIFSIQVTPYGEQKYVIMYEDKDHIGIYIEIFAENDELISAFEILSTATRVYYNSRQVLLSDGKLFYFWNSQDRETHRYDTMGQLFSSDFANIGTPFRIPNNPRFASHPRSDGFTLPNNKFVLHWHGPGSYIRFFDNDPIVHQLALFNLLEPPNGESIETTFPTFTWTKANTIPWNLPLEISYKLYYADNPTFSNGTKVLLYRDTTFTAPSLERGMTYFWKVLSTNIDGDSLWSDQINSFYVDSSAYTSVSDFSTQIPVKYDLLQNFPNPFKSKTTFSFTVSQRDRVVLKIFDLLGREVTTLIDDVELEGINKVDFYAKDLTPGIYFYSLSGSKFSYAKKFILLK